ncbi:MAG: ErfK/YbiS/YcfS/YnhG family protein [Chthoniobacteraceae bacterium]|nr:ErfK/YbiS/YcfS/YnhG family protein [Chthoniobacteraceae bacterium]
MEKIILILVLMTAATCVQRGKSEEPAPVVPALSGVERIAIARMNKEALLRERFKQAGLPYPPRKIFLRAFKREAILELWAREEEGGTYKLIATYPVLASSGGPGPKFKEGDRQVPEGFYFIDRFNPESRFHLSLGLNYPNAADRLVVDPEHPGGDIFIHGGAISIGCLPIGDPAIEELFLVALDTATRGQLNIPVDIFPTRMSGPEWESFARESFARDRSLETFWNQLALGYATFEPEHRVLEKRPESRH